MDQADTRELEVEPSWSRAMSERERVELWRLEWALRLGYTVDVAESLASSPADMHLLERLIVCGCSLELAAKIV